MSEQERPTVAQKSPIIQEMEPGTYFWCSCGKSENQPFCDGSHSGTGFSPVEFEVKEKKRVVWCACKYSKKQPLCDGAHSRLPADA